jgi:hypothetical protein
MAYTFTTNGSYIDFKDSGVLVRKLSTDSRCIEWGYDNTTPLMVSFEIDNLDYPNIRITDISFDGVTCATQADFGTNIATMFPGYASGGGVGYPAGTKMYLALLTQTGTNAPVATVLQNTLGGTVVWSYDGSGLYTATRTGAFTANKTIIFINTGVPDAFLIFSAKWVDANSVQVGSADIEGLSYVNGLLLNTSIQIIVYP